MRRLAKKMEREKLVLSSLPDLSVQILDQAREHGRVSIGEAIKLTGVSRDTLKEHFRQLVEKGHTARRRTLNLVYAALRQRFIHELLTGQAERTH